MLKPKMHYPSILFDFHKTILFSLIRLARKERDLRAAEGRLKQYEAEIAELKARNDALGYDANRKTDENVVCRERFLIILLRHQHCKMALTISSCLSHYVVRIMILKNKSPR